MRAASRADWASHQRVRSGRWWRETEAGRVGEVPGGPGGEGDGRVAVDASNRARLQPPLEQRQERDLA